MVIEASLADGHHFGMRRQRPQFIPDVIGSGIGVRRMPPGDGIDEIVLLSQGDGPAAAWQVGADGEDARHPHRPGAFQNAREIPRKVGEVEVGMGIPQLDGMNRRIGLNGNLHGRHLRLLSPSRQVSLRAG